MEQVVDDVGECLDGVGGFVVLLFIELYIYFDIIQIVGQLEWNCFGMLFEGIECWVQCKVLFSYEDVKQCVWQILKWQIVNGVQYVCSYVDVFDLIFIVFKVMFEVCGEVVFWVDLQIVVFFQEGIFFYFNGLELLEELLCLGVDVVGVILYFEFICELGVELLYKVIDLVKCYDLLVDVYCDEIDDEQLCFFEILVMFVYCDGFGVWVIVSYIMVMYFYNGVYILWLFCLLKLLGINFVVNLLVNIYLQGCFDDYLKCCGIIWVKELFGVGINICFGYDDVFDFWYLLGIVNMLQVLYMGLYVMQMMGYDEIDGGFDLIICNSVCIFGLWEYGIEVGYLVNLLVLLVCDGFDVVCWQVLVCYLICGGWLFVEMVLVQIMVFFEQVEVVDFICVS